MIIEDEAAMLKFGRTLAAKLKAGDWIAINGSLGAGKTVLCKGILRGLGFEGEVASPSYALVLQYDPPEVKIPVCHADLYRLDDVNDLEELGLEDARADCITLLEWAVRGGSFYADPSHEIEILPLEDGRRELRIKNNHG